jgi:hypothetical protein
MDAPHSNLRPPSRAPWIAGAALLLAAGAVGTLWLRSRTAPPPAAPAPPAAPVAAPEAELPAGPAPEVAADRLRSLLESLSADARYRGWLPEGDWVRRWAVVTDNLAEGVSPRKPLAFLAPARPFSVATAPGRMVIAPDAYRRYDGFAEAIASVDARAAAAAWRALHPVLEAAWRALGYPRGSVDAVVARALNRLEAAPVRDGEVAVVEGKGALYAFAEPALEDLGGVEKHLLRMGPRNTRLLQSKAREIREALQLPAAAGAAPPARRP